ncbi:type II toxin-antitoxin system RelE/ParE family toxin [Deinococcus sp. RL]|uniref:type II toxin-antitoxin system RelE family toxin n=1 Tax=Deinococcus sp. RL TaxID=1489678 RepID=UPI00054E740B|nr:type II toxin-antitoxin system RelE/ParE family toxin [Deinococcus sp. RL]
MTDEADNDLAQISDAATREVVLRRALALREEPLKQGKPLQEPLKHYRSVRAAGQRYRIVYQVAVSAGQVIVVVIGIRKQGSKRDVYAVAERRLK